MNSSFSSVFFFVITLLPIIFSYLQFDMGDVLIGGETSGMDIYIYIFFLTYYAETVDTLYNLSLLACYGIE